MSKQKVKYDVNFRFTKVWFYFSQFSKNRTLTKSESTVLLLFLAFMGERGEEDYYPIKYIF